MGAEGKIGGLTDEELETTKKALIKQLEQKVVRLSEEVGRFWDVILDDQELFEFDRREKKIAALSQVTVPQIQELLKSLAFEKTARANMKLYSHNHWNQ